MEHNYKTTAVEADPVAAAQRAWDFIRLERKKSPTEWDNRDPAEKISTVRAAHSEFYDRYMIPARHMTVYHEYSKKAFERYLKKLKTKGYSGQEEWVERQADYVKWLWQDYNPRHPENEAREVWQQTRKNLLGEMTGFKRDFDEAKKIADAKNSELDKEIRKDVLGAAKDNAQLRELLLAHMRSSQPADVDADK